MEDICPDCKHPVEVHAMYRDGRCPVVVFRASTRQIANLWVDTALAFEGRTRDDLPALAECDS